MTNDNNNVALLHISPAFVIYWDKDLFVTDQFSLDIKVKSYNFFSLYFIKESWYERCLKWAVRKSVGIRG
jgi:hypothetical protein